MTQQEASKVMRRKDFVKSNGRYQRARADENQQVYEYIRDHGPCSTRDIAEGLTRLYRVAPTTRQVSRKVLKLQSEGYIEQIEGKGNLGIPVWQIKTQEVTE